MDGINKKVLVRTINKSYTIKDYSEHIKLDIENVRKNIRKGNVQNGLGGECTKRKVAKAF